MKYHLPPNDPRYLSMTEEDIEAEYWAHYYHEHGDVDEFESDNFDEEAFLAEEIDPNDWVDVINEQAD